MSIDFFETPSSRLKFERNLNFLAEALHQKRFFVRSGLTHTIEGIRRVRYLPNRRVDLLTVDESTRLNANMIARFANQEPAITGAAPGQEPGAAGEGAEPADQSEIDEPESDEDEEDDEGDE